MELNTKPSITSNGAMLGFFFCAVSGLVLTFLCVLHSFSILSISQHNHFISDGREKAREEKEGERRLWERCVNRLRFSTVSIAAAREKRERWLSRSGGLPPLFGSPFSP